MFSNITSINVVNNIASYCEDLKDKINLGSIDKIHNNWLKNKSDIYDDLNFEDLITIANSSTTMNMVNNILNKVHKLSIFDYYYDYFKMHVDKFPQLKQLNILYDSSFSESDKKLNIDEINLKLKKLENLDKIFKNYNCENFKEFKSNEFKNITSLEYASYKYFDKNYDLDLCKFPNLTRLQIGQDNLQDYNFEDKYDSYPEKMYKLNNIYASNEKLIFPDLKTLILETDNPFLGDFKGEISKFK